MPTDAEKAQKARVSELNARIRELEARQGHAERLADDAAYWRSESARAEARIRELEARQAAADRLANAVRQYGRQRPGIEDEQAMYAALAAYREASDAD